MNVDLSEANNTVLLKTGEIIYIKKMSASEKSVSFEGSKYLILEDLFDYPCKSQNVGVYKLGPQSNRLIKFEILDVKRKCVVLSGDKIKVAVTLLHSPGC